MSSNSRVDGVLVTWGDRLFFPGNRLVKPDSQPRLRSFKGRGSASWIRARIEGTVRRSPQVMVKVTGGGRGMKAIAAHFRYISKNGRLDIEDDQGNVSRGKDAVRELTEDWRMGGSLIENESHRREAFNIILSMPRGTDALAVLRAAREFAQEELADHKHVMVLHDHQANPHVHLCVRAESKSGRRLNPRKADLHRWRETFAEKLRGWGIEAEASRQVARGATRNYPSLWQAKARDEGRLRKALRAQKSGRRATAHRAEAQEAWRHLASALADSPDLRDQSLSTRVAQLLGQPSRVQRQVAMQQPRAAETRLPERDASLASRRSPDVGQDRGGR